MNDYRIAYTTETGESQYSTTTERTEAAARKYFNAMNRGSGFTITSVELIRENTCATKQQERDTLEAIKKMVEELGPQSYLATAFEGCFEDAESNIENDFGDSYKRRCESLEQKLGEARETIDQMKSDIRLLSNELENSRSTIASMQERLEAELANGLTEDNLTDAIQLVSDKRLALEDEVNNAAKRIVEAAGEPESAAFKNAVNDHRAAKRDLDYYTALMERLCASRKAVTERKEVA